MKLTWFPLFFPTLHTCPLPISSSGNPTSWEGGSSVALSFLEAPYTVGWCGARWDSCAFSIHPVYSDRAVFTVPLQGFVQQQAFSQLAKENLAVLWEGSKYLANSPCLFFFFFFCLSSWNVIPICPCCTRERVLTMSLYLQLHWYKWTPGSMKMHAAGRRGSIMFWSPPPLSIYFVSTGKSKFVILLGYQTEKLYDFSFG